MTIEWNPYPETKPPKNGRYLISSNHDDHPIQIDEYDMDSRENWWDHHSEEIIAWAALPEPYEKPVRLKAYPIKTVPKEGKILLLCKNKDGFSLGKYDMDVIKNYKPPKETGWTHWTPLLEFDFVEEE